MTQESILLNYIHRYFVSTWAASTFRRLTIPHLSHTFPRDNVYIIADVIRDVIIVRSAVTVARERKSPGYRDFAIRPPFLFLATRAILIVAYSIAHEDCFKDK